MAQAAPRSLHNPPRQGAAGGLPDVGFGARSQKPVGSAGWVAALYIKMAPATSASVVPKRCV